MHFGLGMSVILFGTPSATRAELEYLENKGQPRLLEDSGRQVAT
jgi:hypothetical protein